MDVQMGYDQLRLTPGAWLDLLLGRWETGPGSAPNLGEFGGRTPCLASGQDRRLAVGVKVVPSGSRSRPRVSLSHFNECNLGLLRSSVRVIIVGSETGRGCPTERTSRRVFDLAVVRWK